MSDWSSGSITSGMTTTVSSWGWFGLVLATNGA